MPYVKSPSLRFAILNSQFGAPGVKSTFLRVESKGGPHVQFNRFACPSSLQKSNLLQKRIIVYPSRGGHSPPCVPFSFLPASLFLSLPFVGCLPLSDIPTMLFPDSEGVLLFSSKTAFFFFSIVQGGESCKLSRSSGHPLLLRLIDLPTAHLSGPIRYIQRHTPLAFRPYRFSA